MARISELLVQQGADIGSNRISRGGRIAIVQNARDGMRFAAFRAPQRGIEAIQRAIAIQQDLGLKLEARKQQPIEMLVIDTVNKVPIEN